MKLFLETNVIRTSVVNSFFVTFSILFFMSINALLYAGEKEVRKGAWIDEVVAGRQASASTAFRQLINKELHLYATDITNPELYESILDRDDIDYERQMGQSVELSFNPAGPVFAESGKLNPFALAEVREAINWLVDRDYIVGEIYDGMAQPTWFPISNSFPDYARSVEKARVLEQRYSHDPRKAESIITQAMEELGAEKVDDEWRYDGEVVELRLLIRTEDQRREIGDYLAALLENLGFDVLRDYRSASDASPVWTGADPEQGLFHIYTGAWISTVIQRDQTNVFNFYYTPRGMGVPLWQAYQPSDEFDEVSERLGRRDFDSLEERQELFERGMELALENSVRIWLVEPFSVAPRRSEVSVAADLAGGISGAYLWPYTLRIGDQIGGVANIALADLIADPWNPLNGSNWIFDMMFKRATNDYGVIIDPYTGLQWPQRIEKADVVLQQGLPVQKTHDWVNLEFAEQIDVPDDAWIDWDAENQIFQTVEDQYPDGLTARRKSVVYYPEELFDIQWHDGSKLSIADFVLSMILSFDRADEASKLFDHSQVPAFESFKRNFRGVRIASESPLIIETYSESFSLDAENNVSTWFPTYTHGPGPWHTVTLGIMAEREGKLAFSNHKADQLQIQWTDMTRESESLSILNDMLKQASSDNYIPYGDVLREFVTENDVAERWQNLQQWYDDKEHFWVGLGPFYLHRIHPVEENIHLKRFEDYPDPADRWSMFEEPIMPQVSISGPRSIRRGQEVEFSVNVTFKDEPYKSEFLDDVTYLWYDSRDNVIFRGTLSEIEDGKWGVRFEPEQTEDLAIGPNILEVAVVSNQVSIPVFQTREFVVRP